VGDIAFHEKGGKGRWPKMTSEARERTDAGWKGVVEKKKKNRKEIIERKGGADRQIERGGGKFAAITA